MLVIKSSNPRLRCEAGGVLVLYQFTINKVRYFVKKKYFTDRCVCKAHVCTVYDRPIIEGTTNLRLHKVLPKCVQSSLTKKLSSTKKGQNLKHGVAFYEDDILAVSNLAVKGCNLCLFFSSSPSTDPIGSRSFYACCTFTCV